MDFSAWHENYSRLYMVKVFPESWEQYSIDSELRSSLVLDQWCSLMFP